MKIALISFYCLDSTIPLAAHLAEGNDVDLYCLMSQSMKNLLVIDLSRVQIRNGLHDKAETEPLVDEYLKKYLNGRIRPMLYVFATMHPRRLSFFLQTLELVRHIRKQGYDVIHIVGQNYALVILHLLLRHLPRVHTLHEVDSNWGEIPFAAKAMFYYLAKSRAHLIFPSQTTSNRFLSKYPITKSRTHVIRFGLYEFYSFVKIDGVSEGVNSVLYFGMIREYKGVDYLVEASKLVAAKIPDLKVIIAGYNYYYNFEGIRGDKHFEIIERFLTSEEIVNLNTRATLVVCPYSSASQSGILMTSYALNKPVIATRVDGLAEVVVDGVTGLLVPPRDANALAEAMVVLLHDSELRTSMKKEIKKRYHEGEYSWMNIASQTKSVYLQAMGHLDTARPS